MNNKNKKSPLKRMGTKHSERGARRPSFTPNFSEARGNVPKKGRFPRASAYFYEIMGRRIGKKIVNFAGIMQHRVDAFQQETQTKKSIHLTLITAAGVTASSDTHSIQSMLTMDALFL